MAYGFPRNADTATCYGAAVDVYSLGWAFRGTAVYLHTASTRTASFNINGSWIGNYTSGGQVGTSDRPNSRSNLRARTRAFCHAMRFSKRFTAGIGQS